MFDAAIGPRLEASSLRMRRVFSAAGTLDVTFAGAALGAGPAAGALGEGSTRRRPRRCRCRRWCWWLAWFLFASGGVRYPVLKHAPSTGPEQESQHAHVWNSRLSRSAGGPSAPIRPAPGVFRWTPGCVALAQGDGSSAVNTSRLTRQTGRGGMKPDLSGQVALVAGATRGAGRGTAVALGEAGATVYCTGRSALGRRSDVRPARDRRGNGGPGKRGRRRGDRRRRRPPPACARWKRWCGGSTPSRAGWTSW